MRIASFECSFREGTLTDIGRRRQENQDTIVACPELGFFAVSDGMGGTRSGGIASEFVRQSAPLLMQANAAKLEEANSSDAAAELLWGIASAMSNKLYETMNGNGRIVCGATFCGVWLVGGKALFVNLGDSRGYLLRKYKKLPEQVTEDHNLAGILVKNGELTKEEARDHPGSSRLTAFVGMPPPALPETFIREVHPGDRILLCSDGLYGMVEERAIARLMRSSRSSDRVCQRLIGAANESGGRDNISCVYIRVLP